MVQRLDYIDITKGIGIILVVLSHTDYSNLIHYALSFYVPIFFLCSGYTTSSKTTQINFKENFKKHAIKLIKPYIFFSIILVFIFQQFYLQGIIGIIYSRYCLYPFGSPELYRFLINGNYPLWFLTCMIVSYYLFYLLIYNSKWQYYLVSLYIIITLMLSYLPILLPWSIDTAFYMALFMFTGMQIRYNCNLYTSKKPHPLIILSILTYILLLPFCDNINLSVREYGLSIATSFIAGLTGCIAIIFIARLLEGTIIGKGLQLIGKHSLTIFCIEIPFIVLIGRPIATFFLSNVSSSLELTQICTALIEAAVACLGGLSLSALLHKNERVRKLIY